MKQGEARLLHVITRAEVRGAEKAGANLSADLAARGWDSSVVALARCRTTGGSLDVSALGGHPVSIRTLTALRRLARTASLVVAHGSSTLPACALALRGTGIPFVYVNIGDPGFWAASWLQRTRVRAALSTAAGIAALTDDARNIYVQRFGLTRTPIEVIPNYRSAEHFFPVGAGERLQRRRELGLRANDFLIVFLGALAPEKRIDLALKAVERSDDAILWIAGSGPDEQKLRRQAAKLDSRVKFLGPVGKPGRLLQLADCLLLTSDSEGLPGVLIEAGLSGVPCVATDVGWVREIIVPGETGVLVRPDDAIDIAKGIAAVRAEPDRYIEPAFAHCQNNFESGPVLERWVAFLNRMAG